MCFQSIGICLIKCTNRRHYTCICKSQSACLIELSTVDMPPSNFLQIFHTSCSSVRLLKNRSTQGRRNLHRALSRSVKTRKLLGETYQSDFSSQLPKAPVTRQNAIDAAMIKQLKLLLSLPELTMSQHKPARVSVIVPKILLIIVIIAIFQPEQYGKGLKMGPRSAGRNVKCLGLIGPIFGSGVLSGLAFRHLYRQHFPSTLQGHLSN
jgi:hypothetical protein